MTLAEGRRERDVALAAVEIAAAAKWRRAAEMTVRQIPSGELFTTDRVHFWLARLGLETHEPRALGAVMMKLVREGVIVKTGKYRQSRRPACHSRPIPVWKRV